MTILKRGETDGDREVQCKSVDTDLGDIKEIRLPSQTTNLESRSRSMFRSPHGL